MEKVADGFRFARVGFEVEQLQAGTERELPSARTYGGQLSFTAMIEEGIQVFLLREEARPFA